MICKLYFAKANINLCSLLSSNISLNLHTFMPQHNTSTFLNATPILNIPYLRINISRKSKFFWNRFEKNCFLPISPKILKFEKKLVFFRSIWKILFCSYVHNISISRKITFFRLLLKIVFARLIENNNISAKTTFYEIILKKSSLSIYSKISTFRGNARFLRSFKKK